MLACKGIFTQPSMSQGYPQDSEGIAQSLQCKISCVYYTITTKESENDDGTIVRLYESKNKRCKVTLTSDMQFKKAYLCDLTENELDELDIHNGCIALEIGCFELVTVKLK